MNNGITIELETLQAELLQCRKEKEHLREQNGQLQDANKRLQEQVTETLEVNAQLIENAEKTHEKYDEQQRELSEEIKAGWAFESNEQRAEIVRLENEVERRRGVETVLKKRNDELFESLVSYFPSVEKDVRAGVESEEKTERVKAYSFFIRQECLPIPITSNESTCAGLLKLNEYVKNGAINATVVKEVLKEEVHVRELLLQLIGMHHYAGYFPIAFGILAFFLSTVVFQLPQLKQIKLAFVPSPRKYLLPLLDSVPPTLESLHLIHSSYTVADLLVITQRCPALRELGVTLGCCADFLRISVEEKDTQMKTVNQKCKGIIIWLR